MGTQTGDGLILSGEEVMCSPRGCASTPRDSASISADVRAQSVSIPPIPISSRPLSTLVLLVRAPSIPSRHRRYVSRALPTQTLDYPATV